MARKKQKTSCINQTSSIKYFITLSNQTRLLILELLNRNKEGLILSELQKQINQTTKHNFSFSSIFDHVNILQNHQFVKTKRLWKNKGQPRRVQINEKILPIIFRVGGVIKWQQH